MTPDDISAGETFCTHVLQSGIAQIEVFKRTIKLTLPNGRNEFSLCAKSQNRNNFVRITRFHKMRCMERVATHFPTFSKKKKPFSYQWGATHIWNPLTKQFWATTTQYCTCSHSPERRRIIIRFFFILLSILQNDETEKQNLKQFS